MVILNVMLSKDLGGIQQSFLDYGKSLSERCEVVNVTAKNAKINDFIKADFNVPNVCSLDFYSVFMLGFIMAKVDPDVVIVHGNRAVKFACYARRICKFWDLKGRDVKIVGVAHDYKHKRLLMCDYVIGVSKSICGYLLENGVENVEYIPNMIDVVDGVRGFGGNKSRKVIGIMSRIVKKKGVDVFLRAVKILKDKGYKFDCVIAGDGPELDNMRHLSVKLDVQDVVKFLGWTNDKNGFYSGIDVFCLPSLREPFGIVLLEAMNYKLPIVATNVDGPADIVVDGLNGLLCEPDNAEDLSAKLGKMLEMSDGDFASMGRNGHERMLADYSIGVVGEKIYDHINAICYI